MEEVGHPGISTTDNGLSLETVSLPMPVSFFVPGWLANCWEAEILNNISQNEKKL